MRPRLIPAVAVSLIAAAGSAHAQTAAGTDWSSRGFFAASAGVRLGTVTFDESHREPVGAEDFTWSADYEVKTGLAFDVGAGARLWRRLVAAVSFTRANDSRPAVISGSVPHPFYFDQPREIAGESADLDHVEQAFHVSAMWIVPAGRRTEVGVFGGPSFVQVRRDFVSEVRYDEEYPYDEASLAGASVEEASERSVGFHAGADVTWLMTRTAGLGVTARYTYAPVTVDSPAGNQVDIDAGGLQVVAGLRLRFGGLPPRAPRGSTPAPAPAPEPQPRTSPPGSRPVSSQFPEGTVMQATPVYLRPDETRTPLRQLPANMRVRILQTQDDWLRVEFNDERLGRRVGYVRRSAVRIDPGGGF